MSLQSLIASGTKVWLDGVEPNDVKKNRALGITGATSNPIIISDLIQTGRFDSDLQQLVKAGILSGAFYIQAAALFATAGAMALWSRTGLPPLGISLFGIVSAACFFVPGLKYYRQQRLRLRG